MAVPFKVVVHLIEGRDIAASSKSVPNPYMEVIVGDQVRDTFITHESNKCIWNLTYSFDLALTPDEYSRATIKLRLKSANILSRDDVLGVYAFTIKSVHTQTENPCQIIDTWVAVPDQYSPSKVAGNVRLTVSVAGPWDNVNPALMPNTGEPTNAEEAAAAAAAALTALTKADPRAHEGIPESATAIKTTAAELEPVGPIKVDRKARVLKLRVYRGEDLPCVDMGANTNQGCSPYIRIRHGTEVAVSQTQYGNQGPSWNEEIMLPCYRTGHTDTIFIELWHKRTFGPDLLLGSHQLSLQDLAMRPRKIQWFNFVGPVVDADYISDAMRGPGITGAIVSAMQSMMPLATRPGLARPAACVGRVLMWIELGDRNEPPVRMTRSIRSPPPEPLTACTLVTLRVLEIHGIDCGTLGQARVAVSYGAQARVSEWGAPKAGIVTLNFVPERHLLARNHPFIRPGMPPYQVRQAFDVYFNVYVFSPLAGGCTHIGTASVPAIDVLRQWGDDGTARSGGGAPGQERWRDRRPVQPMWVNVRPAYRSNSPAEGGGNNAAAAAAKAIKADSAPVGSQPAPDANAPQEEDGPVPTGLFGHDPVAFGSGGIRLLIQLAITQRVLAGGGKSAKASIHVSGAADSDEDVAPASSDGAKGGAAADAGGGDDDDEGLDPVQEVGMFHPPLTLPAAGEAAAASDRIRLMYLENKAANAGSDGKPAGGKLGDGRGGSSAKSIDPMEGEEALDTSDDETKVYKSGPKFMDRLYKGKLDPEVVLHRKLFCVVYQARNLPVPAQVFLQKSYRQRQRVRSRLRGTGKGFMESLGLGGEDENEYYYSEDEEGRPRKHKVLSPDEVMAQKKAEAKAKEAREKAIKEGKEPPPDATADAFDTPVSEPPSALQTLKAGSDPAYGTRNMLGMAPGGFPGAPVLENPPPVTTGGAAASSSSKGGFLSSMFGGGKGAPSADQPPEDEIEDAYDGLTVELKTHLTQPHRTPPAASVSPSPLWYHACVLPLRIVVRPPRRKKKAWEAEIKRLATLGQALAAAVLAVKEEQRIQEEAEAREEARRLAAAEAEGAAAAKGEEDAGAAAAGAGASVRAGEQAEGVGAAGAGAVGPDHVAIRVGPLPAPAAGAEVPAKDKDGKPLPGNKDAPADAAVDVEPEEDPRTARLREVAQQSLATNLQAYKDDRTRQIRANERAPKMTPLEHVAAEVAVRVFKEPERFSDAAAAEARRQKERLAKQVPGGAGFVDAVAEALGVKGVLKFTKDLGTSMEKITAEKAETAAQASARKRKELKELERNLAMTKQAQALAEYAAHTAPDEDDQDVDDSYKHPRTLR